jgi:flagellum-specific ATP synthase
MTTTLAPQISLVPEVDTHAVLGRVVEITGLTTVVADLHLPVGEMCCIRQGDGKSILAQVIGRRDELAVVMPLEDSHSAGGGSCGDSVESVAGGTGRATLPVGFELLGRVIDGLGRPLDGCPAPNCAVQYPVYAPAPAAMARQPIDEPLSTGVRAIDALVTVGRGQRLGIFSGTGVGKSTLLGMIARHTGADCLVMAMIGERGREVGDFLRRDLGEEGLKRSTVVVATSDQSPVLRVRACFVATAVAEFYRDQGKNVLLLMDSLTRLAMAQRQIGLAAGEPPTTKGYPPSTFSLMPQLLERAGRTEQGSITGFYAVLVEGDDVTEPISDAVRGTLDGHVWLSRALANRKHYPAISTTESVSRIMPHVTDAEHQEAAKKIQRIVATWEEIEDLVNIGAYARGTTPEYDLTIEMKPKVDAFLQQEMNERIEFDAARTELLKLGEEIDKAARRIGQAQASQQA